MPLRVRIRVQGEEQIQQTFNGWERRAENTRPAFQAITRDFRKIMTKQFNTEGAYLNGVPWLGLADSTLRRKETEGLDMRVLHATRKMRKSFTTGRVGYRQITADLFRIGSVYPYASLHQTGTPKMPQRRIFQFTPWLTNRWTGFIGEHLTHGTITIRSLR